MRLPLLALAITLIASCATSKVYTPSAVSVVPRAGLLTGVPVQVGVFDARAVTAASDGLRAQLVDLVRRGYPSANVNTIPQGAFYSDATPGAVTLRITIAAYASGFGSQALVGIGQVGGRLSYMVVPEGKWNGVTAFTVSLVDCRASACANHATAIEKVVSQPNTWGYRTAEAVLSQSFTHASQDMLLWVDTRVLR